MIFKISRRSAHKKGLISLETLIIFIAVVLIAALSASVLIRNSGILSQRALTVSEESRERLISGVDIISVSGQANITDESINDLEILMRLKPGSQPVQLKNLQLLFTTQDTSTQGTLQHSTATNQYDDIDVSTVTNASSTISDIEDSILDTGSTIETIYLYNNSGSTELRINLSYASNNVDSITGESPALAIVSLGADLSNTGVTLSITDAPIKVNGAVYGFLTISGTTTTVLSLAGTTATISNFPSTDNCVFTTLIPEKRFCLDVSIGDGDTTLEKGELVSIKYSFRPENVLALEEPYELRLIPKEGAIETLNAITPSTVVVEKTTLFG